MQHFNVELRELDIDSCPPINHFLYILSKLHFFLKSLYCRHLSPDFLVLMNSLIYTCILYLILNYLKKIPSSFGSTKTALIKITSFNLKPFMHLNSQ